MSLTPEQLLEAAQAAPPKVGTWVRINTGVFEGYTGQVTRLAARGRAVHFPITVFDRPVELNLDYDTAAQILDTVAASSGEPAPPDAALADERDRSAREALFRLTAAWYATGVVYCCRGGFLPWP